jgi:hypothetical protein
MAASSGRETAPQTSVSILSAARCAALWAGSSLGRACCDSPTMSPSRVSITWSWRATSKTGAILSFQTANAVRMVRLQSASRRCAGHPPCQPLGRAVGRPQRSDRSRAAPLATDRPGCRWVAETRLWHAMASRTRDSACCRPQRRARQPAHVHGVGCMGPQSRAWHVPGSGDGGSAQDCGAAGECSRVRRRLRHADL